MRDIICRMRDTYFIVVLGIGKWDVRSILGAALFFTRDKLAQINPVKNGENCTLIDRVLACVNLF